jgi:hypothetical protein
MGVTWALAWALAGIGIGLLSFVTPWLPWDAFFEFWDAPLPALAVPGFFGGATFSLVLGVAGRHRRFDQLSMGRFAAWGALGGILLSLIPAGMVLLGLATSTASSPGLLLVTLAIAPPFAFLGAVSAAGTLAVARAGEDRALLDEGEEVAGAGLSEAERRELLGG